MNKILSKFRVRKGCQSQNCISTSLKVHMHHVDLSEVHNAYIESETVTGRLDFLFCENHPQKIYAVVEEQSANIVPHIIALCNEWAWMMYNSHIPHICDAEIVEVIIKTDDTRTRESSESKNNLRPVSELMLIDKIFFNPTEEFTAEQDALWEQSQMSEATFSGMWMLDWKKPDIELRQQTLNVTRDVLTRLCEERVGKDNVYIYEQILPLPSFGADFDSAPDGNIDTESFSQSAMHMDMARRYAYRQGRDALVRGAHYRDVAYEVLPSASNKDKCCIALTYKMKYPRCFNPVIEADRHLQLQKLLERDTDEECRYIIETINEALNKDLDECLAISDLAVAPALSSATAMRFVHALPKRRKLNLRSWCEAIKYRINVKGRTVS